jgi:protein-L-isoaspartate O-methyltransferase
MMNALLLPLALLSTVEPFTPPSQLIKIPCHHEAACRGNSSVRKRRYCTSLLSSLPRRNFLQSSLLLGTVQIIRRPKEAIASEEEEETTKPFHSAAYTLKEYTNSIVASRDTNISPKEVYDTISSTYLSSTYDAAIKSNKKPRALDVGAGAGVSTEVLYRLGYHDIDALDWSGEAWTRYVVDDPTGYCPEGVRFYELDDERYLDQWRGAKNNNNNNGDEQLFDVIVFNFAVNESKAQQFAKELLNKQHGRLLAPINTSNDYWLKQTYQVLDSEGKVLWSAVDVGAWSVQFQPDVTQDTCSGIWCAPFNGFQKKR